MMKGRGQCHLPLLLSLCFNLGIAVTYVKVGVLLISENGSPYDYERTAAAIDLAAIKVNRDILNGTGYEIATIMKKYGPACDASTAPGKKSFGH